jgi:predicted transcriptional regulator
MTQVIGTSRRVLDQRRELLAELHRVQLTLETADVLDRAAGRLANRRLAEVLHECAEDRRRAARSVRAGLTARMA